MTTDVNHYGEIIRAIDLAAVAHKDQVRKATGEPYINHLVETVYLLIYIGGVDDIDTIQAAILHDVVEDTEVTFYDLKLEYNTTVVEYIRDLTEEKILNKRSRKMSILQHLHGANRNVKLIKLADVCSNIDVVPPDWDRETTLEYLDYTELVAEICKDASLDLYNEYIKRSANTVELIKQRFSETDADLLAKNLTDYEWGYDAETETETETETATDEK